METQKKFSQSVGAGIKSMFGTSGRTFCILEHKTTSEKHKAGERQEIIVDQIFLGRDKSCQISFGNSFPTVSRKHAVITKKGESWVITHQGSNPTLVNGRPVAKEWYLQNGDEIQLSMEGPRMGFLIPQNSLVKSINISRRLSLFRQQALRPYKTAIATMGVVFLLAITALSYFLYDTMESYENIVAENKLLAQQALEFSGNLDSLQNEINNNKVTQRRMEAEMNRLKETSEKMIEGGTTGVTPPPSMDPLFPSVFFITIESIELQSGSEVETTNEVSWLGTGFLLEDGRFITARHVIEPWLYPDDSDIMLALNFISNNGGKVTVNLIAYSPDGTQLRFTNHDFHANTSRDQIKSGTDESGNPFILKSASLEDGTDWAYARTNKKGVISFSNELSRNLQQQSSLHILGYPRGIGANSETDIRPIYGSCIVASAGLNNDIINVSDRNFTNGNSGGPVFVLQDNKYIAIGVVSAMVDNIGFIIPIASAM